MATRSRALGRLGLGASLLGAMIAGCAQILGADWGGYEGSEATGSGGQGGQGGGCVDPATDCPATANACVAAVCEGGTCGEQNVAEGTPLSSQPAGGCVEVQCDGNGGTVDVPLPERTPCTEGGQLCTEAGACVECLDDADCASGNCQGTLCVGTCGSADVVAMPPSCQSGDSGAGPNCGPNNTSCCDNKLIPCGTYLRSYDGVTYTDDTNPATVSDFRLDTYEITVGRFRAFVNAGQGTQLNPPAPGAGAHPKIPGTGWNAAWNTNLTVDTTALKAALNCGGYQTWTDMPGSNEKLPVNCIDWYEAFAFCVWDHGRLPTESEWNYAAAGGERQLQYPWGSEIDSTYAVYACAGDGNAGCAFSDILPVGSRSPKGDGVWGQSDLAGNVFEWAFDGFDGYINDCNDCANIGSIADRVARGGDFGVINELYLLSSVRLSGDPSAGNVELGARCARSP